LHRIPEAYKRAVAPQFGILLFSSNLSDFIDRAAYLQAVQKEDAALVYQVKATQNSYNDSKKLREDKKTQLDQVQKQLEAQSQQLAQQKQAKDSLLAQTQGQEAIYQQLLAAAKAQLAGFSSFASNQGGATILSNQTVCDDWGVIIINGTANGAMYRSIILHIVLPQMDVLLRLCNDIHPFWPQRCNADYH